MHLVGYFHNCITMHEFMKVNPRTISTVLIMNTSLHTFLQPSPTSAFVYQNIRFSKLLSNTINLHSTLRIKNQTSYNTNNKKNNSYVHVRVHFLCEPWKNTMRHFFDVNKNLRILLLTQDIKGNIFQPITVTFRPSSIIRNGNSTKD